MFLYNIAMSPMPCYSSVLKYLPTFSLVVFVLLFKCLLCLEEESHSCFLTGGVPLCMVFASCLICVVLLIHPVLTASQQCGMAEHSH